MQFGDREVAMYHYIKLIYFDKETLLLKHFDKPCCVITILLSWLISAIDKAHHDNNL